MATTKRQGLPEVWPSAIAGLLSGDKSCQLAAWLPAHFRIEKIESGFDFAAWKVEHTALMETWLQKLKALHYDCTVENQNHFRLAGQTCVLVGKPDIVGRRKDGVVRVADAKTGQPQASHALQVSIYMVALPMVWHRPTMRVEGEVVYQDHTVDISPEEVNPIRPRLFALLRRMGADLRPEAVPSEAECRFCSVSEMDCPDRFKADPLVETVTDAF
jgi:hypothetical protein